MAERINAIRSLAGGNPQAMAEQMMRTNPRFAEFVRANQGKSAEQIAQENGLDWGAVTRAMGK